MSEDVEHEKGRSSMTSSRCGDAEIYKRDGITYFRWKGVEHPIHPQVVIPPDVRDNYERLVYLSELIAELNAWVITSRNDQSAREKTIYLVNENHRIANELKGKAEPLTAYCNDCERDVPIRKDEQNTYHCLICGIYLLTVDVVAPNDEEHAVAGE